MRCLLFISKLPTVFVAALTYLKARATVKRFPFANPPSVLALRQNDRLGIMVGFVIDEPILVTHLIVFFWVRSMRIRLDLDGPSIDDFRYRVRVAVGGAILGYTHPDRRLGHAVNGMSMGNEIGKSC